MTGAHSLLGGRYLSRTQHSEHCYSFFTFQKTPRITFRCRCIAFDFEEVHINRLLAWIFSQFYLSRLNATERVAIVRLMNRKTHFPKRYFHDEGTTSQSIALNMLGVTIAEYELGRKHHIDLGQYKKGLPVACDAAS